MSNQGRWCNHAFGLAINSSFALVGFPGNARSAGRDRPAVSLDLASPEALREPFAQGSEAIGWRRDPGGRPIAVDILAHPTAGFLLDGPVGRFQVFGSGDHVHCGPRDEADWRWQRYLLGRVLPFAATLNGLEPWHASAVAGPAGAIALMGDSGTGKTTIAAELMLAGAVLVADDVASVELSDGRPLVHPGPPLMSVRGPGFSPDELERLGSAVASEAGSLRLAVRRANDALALRSVYVLSRDTRPGPRFEALPAPNRLIGGTFNFAIRDPVRLSRQLVVASAIWMHAEPVRVRVEPDADRRAVAREIQRHASDRSDGRLGPS